MDNSLGYPSTWTRVPEHEGRLSIVFLIYVDRWYRVHIFAEGDGLQLNICVEGIRLEQPKDDVLLFHRSYGNIILETYTPENPMYEALMRWMDKGIHSSSQHDCPYTHKVKEHLLTYREEALNWADNTLFSPMTLLARAV